MKIKFNLLIKSLFVFLISCDLGKKTYSSYELVNDTNYQIVINSYDRLNKSLENTIQLLNNGDKWESERFQTSEPGGQFLEPNHFLKGDSIRVIFNNKKVLIHIDEYSSDNIFYVENYEIIMNDENHSLRRYSFSEEDYKNAGDL